MNYYFDNASTARPNQIARSICERYAEEYYNPSALYLPASNIALEIRNARENILKKFNAHNKSQFIFTPSATISNNMLLHNIIKRKNLNYIFSSIEHSSIYNAAKKYKEEGFDIRFIKCDDRGAVDEQDLFSLIDENTAFVSIIHICNETGIINNIKKLSSIAKSKNPKLLFHSDGVQAINKLSIDFSDLNIDFYTISGHKINCFKGIAGLYVRYFNKFNNYIYGGGQEFGIISGTENVAGILTLDSNINNNIITSNHRKILIDRLKKIDNIILFDGDNYIDNIVYFCVKNVRAETIVHMMYDKGFLIGSGSACNSKHKDNRIADALKISKEYAEGSLRISFDTNKKIEEIYKMLNALEDCINIYRNKI